MDFNSLKATLNKRLGDTNNFAFTSEEKDEALTEAINDSLTVSEVWDGSLAFSFGTFQYPKPSTLDVIRDIYLKPDSASEPVKVTSSIWEVVDGNIQFKNNASRFIPHGYILYLKGAKKYTINDSITETNVQEYVLNLAQLHCLNMLGVKKALSFLKNDTSMGEIIALKRELERKVQEYRRQLPRSFEVI